MQLECHSKGDRRFSAFYARLASGSTIEQSYQNAKRDENGRTFANPKGRTPAQLFINGQLYDCTPERRHAFYTMLWQIYFEENPKLLEHASQYSHFRDIFAWRGRVIAREEASNLISGENLDAGCNQAAAVAYLVQCENSFWMHSFLVEAKAAYYAYTAKQAARRTPALA